jgi:hypothetical protein
MSPVMPEADAFAVSTQHACHSTPTTGTEREKWKRALISFTLIRFVDLGVRGSSPRGGTNQISGIEANLQVLFNAAHVYT